MPIAVNAQRPLRALFRPFAGRVSRPESGHLFQIRRQHIFDPFHEYADSARQIAPMCYDEGYGDRPATKIRQDLHKRSTLKVLADPQDWRLNQAKAGKSHDDAPVGA